MMSLLYFVIWSLRFVKGDVEEKSWTFNQLCSVIEKVGKPLYDKGYAEQSRRLETLFLKIGKADNLVAMNALGIAAWYEKLKRVEESSKISFNQRI